MRRCVFLSGFESTNGDTGGKSSELERKINALEKSLQEQISAKSALERELYEIKNSRAWVRGDDVPALSQQLAWRKHPKTQVV